MPKAYSYLRFSTPEQALGDSSRRQIDAARAYAEDHDLEMDDTLKLQDRGVSGFRGNNVRYGALGQFLAAIDDGIVPVGSFLLVENLDRMSRQSAWDTLPIFQLIINAGVNIVTLQDRRVWSKAEMQTNPYRIFESLMVMIRAHEESATKSRRLKEVWENKRRNATSRVLTARVPAWLRVTDDRRFEVIDTKAAIVRRIFQEAVAGFGHNKIARALNIEGVPVFEDGQRWHRSYVAKLLGNPAVVGILVPHTIEHDDGRKVRVKQEPVEGYYPAIIELDAFAAVQALSGSNPQRGRHSKGIVMNVLGGLAKCSSCGATMTRVSKGKRSQPTYVCTAAKTGSGCNYRPIHVEKIEAALVAYMEAYDPEGPLKTTRTRTTRYISEAPANVLEQQIRQTQVDEERLQARITRITILLADGNESKALLDQLQNFEQQLPWIRGKRADLRTKLAEVNSPSAVLRRDRFRESLLKQPLDRREANIAARQWLRSAVIDVDRTRVELLTREGSKESLVFVPSASAAELTRARLRSTKRDKNGRILSNLPKLKSSQDPIEVGLSGSVAER